MKTTTPNRHTITLTHPGWPRPAGHLRPWRRRPRCPNCGSTKTEAPLYVVQAGLVECEECGEVWEPGPKPAA